MIINAYYGRRSKHPIATLLLLPYTAVEVHKVEVHIAEVHEVEVHRVEVPYTFSASAVSFLLPRALHTLLCRGRIRPNLDGGGFLKAISGAVCVDMRMCV